MNRLVRLSFFITAIVIGYLQGNCQPLNNKNVYTKQDTLRGSINTERDWWNVVNYNIDITPDYLSKTITGSCAIEFDITKGGTNKKMQIDLQQPLIIDSILFLNNKISSYKQEENICLINFNDFNFTSAQDALQRKHPVKLYKLKIYYHGKPVEAVRPPWDGGWIWENDELGRPWMTVACQGLGASVWYPCKDHQSDEPDKGATISITVPDTLSAVANGKLDNKKTCPNGTTTWTWKIVNPINNYNIVPYIGKYARWTENYIGETEKNLALDFWVLDYNIDKAKKQFGRDVKPMLKAFENWFGPYPFYEDGYKLVESPHLGMEHQSAVAYGNHYLDGYLGRDLSGSGWGLKWDFIIIHESGHEWFGNNITTKDIADMWVHEGFTQYSEVLFTESLYGKKAADEYAQGLRLGIRNDIPIIGAYGVNKEGSGDMYNKGASIVHMIRQIVNNDARFRDILRGLNRDFYHRTVTTKEVEDYIITKSGIDLSKIFDQYMRTIQVPILEYKISGKTLSYRWANCINGFNMPVFFSCGNTRVKISPTENWKKTTYASWFNEKKFQVDKNFYIKTNKK